MAIGLILPPTLAFFIAGYAAEAARQKVSTHLNFHNQITLYFRTIAPKHNRHAIFRGRVRLCFVRFSLLFHNPIVGIRASKMYSVGYSALRAHMSGTLLVPLSSGLHHLSAIAGAQTQHFTTEIDSYL